MEIIVTKDGSSSIFIPSIQESYHSLNGAIQESKHIFIEAGLKFKSNENSKIAILEVGFGTGLNAYLTALETQNTKINIDFTTIEKFPLGENIYSKLNYEFLLNDINTNLFKTIHQCEWEKKHTILTDFSLLKLQQNIEDCSFVNMFDIIYFDAFSPAAQPELWTVSIFQLMWNALKKDGVLVTYCAKGEVKRILHKIGFSLEMLPGPIGKREMTRALKIIL